MEMLYVIGYTAAVVKLSGKIAKKGPPRKMQFPAPGGGGTLENCS